MKKAQVTRDTGINQDKEMIWMKRGKISYNHADKIVIRGTFKLYQIDEKSTINERYWD